MAALGAILLPLASAACGSQNSELTCESAGNCPDGSPGDATLPEGGDGGAGPADSGDAADASGDTRPVTPDGEAGGEPDTGGEGPDTGAADTGSSDVGAGDGDSGEAAASVPDAKVFVVHASETAPALRFCLGAATAADGGSVHVSSSFRALPDVAAAGLPFPGVFPGAGGPLDDPQNGTDVSTFNVAVFAIDANKLTMDMGGGDGATERNCAQLVGSDGLGSAGTGGGQLTLDTDYWQLGTIPAGTLARGTSWVLAVTGCPAGAGAKSAPFCGAGYDPAKGNLGLTPFQLDSVSTAPMDKMGAQLVHASQAWDAVKQQISAMADGGLFSAAAFYEPIDASTTPKTVVLTLDPVFGSVSPMTMAPIPGLTFDGTSGLAMSFAKGVSPVGQPAAFPLPIIQQLTYGAAGGVAFADGVTFAFVLVGNPTDPTFVDSSGMPCATPSATCVVNGRTVHFLAFPAFNH
jgi:hypothetical protein